MNIDRQQRLEQAGWKVTTLADFLGLSEEDEKVIAQNLVLEYDPYRQDPKFNQIDGIVLDVLIRKHKTIRSSLGVSVPVPVDTAQVIEAVFEKLLLRQQEVEKGTSGQMILPGLEQYVRPQKEKLYRCY